MAHNEFKILILIFGLFFISGCIFGLDFSGIASYKADPVKNYINIRNISYYNLEPLEEDLSYYIQHVKPLSYEFTTLYQDLEFLTPNPNRFRVKNIFDFNINLNDEPLGITNTDLNIYYSSQYDYRTARIIYYLGYIINYSYMTQRFVYTVNVHEFGHVLDKYNILHINKIFKNYSYYLDSKYYINITKFINLIFPVCSNYSFNYSYVDEVIFNKTICFDSWYRYYVNKSNLNNLTLSEIDELSDEIFTRTVTYCLNRTDFEVIDGIKTDKFGFCSNFNFSELFEPNIYLGNKKPIDLYSEYLSDYSINLLYMGYRGYIARTGSFSYEKELTDVGRGLGNFLDLIIGYPKFLIIISVVISISVLIFSFAGIIKNSVKNLSK